jgi:hypothetical protein
MESIFEYVGFVNEQVEFHTRKAQEFHGHKRERLHKKTAERFRGLLAQIEMLQSATILRQIPGSNPLAITTADVKDLPPDLLKQLVNLPDHDRLENDIVDIINGAGGTLLLDHLLITLFKRTGEIHLRAQLVSKLYRMNKKGLIYATSKKGVYTTIPPEQDAGENSLEVDSTYTTPEFEFGTNAQDLVQLVYEPGPLSITNQSLGGKK